MLIRVSGGSAGIAEYLVDGQKQGRELSRDELDERIILEGDLSQTDIIIKGMDRDGERYLHITLAFKEDFIEPELLRRITNDFKEFAMSAYEADEFNFYAEAHLPKIKSYVDRQTGALIERKPHIHIVIPKENLLSGKNLDPFGLVDYQNKFIDAFQEHANAKYGLASPKDNRRAEFTSESAMISRYKADLFQGKAKDLKEQILTDVLDRKISDYGSFKLLLTEYGSVRVRNEGMGTEYLNVKPFDQPKGVNFNKDLVFTREFIEKSETDKRRILAGQIRIHYESQQPARLPAAQLVETLREWDEVRAPQIKYMNSGSKRYRPYITAQRENKIAILAQRAERFYAKYRVSQDFENAGTTKTFQGKEPKNDRPDYDRISAKQVRRRQRAAAVHQSDHQRSRRKAPPKPLSSVRNLSSVGMVQHEGRTKVLLQPDALDRVGRKRSADSEMRRPRAGDSGATAGRELGKGRHSDSVLGQHGADHQERIALLKASEHAEFKQIKQALDARRLLAHLSRTHGLIPEKYEISKGDDGGDRIKAGTSNLNVSDFLTREMSLSFKEAKPILRQVYAEQQRGHEVNEPRAAPRRELWESFRKTQPDWQKQKTQEWNDQRGTEKARRAAIRDAYQVARRAIQGDRSKPAPERKAALSIARMERVGEDMALREAVKGERLQLKTKLGQPYQARYRSFLTELANRGDEDALAELRRQRDTTSVPTGPNVIEGEASTKKRGDRNAKAPIAPQLAYSVDTGGNVTYYADQAKTRALLIDSGKSVTVVDQDNQAVEAGLRLALQKFGPGLKIEGSKEFKRQVLEVVFNTGMHVELGDKTMSTELAVRRAKRGDLQARGKAFIAAEREKATTTPVSPVPGKTPDQDRTQQAEAEKQSHKPPDIER